MQAKGARHDRLSLFALAMPLMLCAALSGCVQRRLTIVSHPPGALVFIGNEQVGVTPVSVNFVYYGVREIRLVKEGYETVVTEHDIRRPWYQVPPLDFFSDNFALREIRDERVLEFALSPRQVVPNDELLRRAEQLRAQSRPGVMAPLPAIPPAASAFPPGPNRLPTAMPSTQLPARDPRHFW